MKQKIARNAIILLIGIFVFGLFQANKQNKFKLLTSLLNGNSKTNNDGGAVSKTGNSNKDLPNKTAKINTFLLYEKLNFKSTCNINTFNPLENLE